MKSNPSLLGMRFISAFTILILIFISIYIYIPVYTKGVCGSHLFKAAWCGGEIWRKILFIIVIGGIWISINIKGCYLFFVYWFGVIDNVEGSINSATIYKNDEIYRQNIQLKFIKKLQPLTKNSEPYISFFVGGRPFICLESHFLTNNQIKTD